ncbi:transcriptional regulator with XRE-family HTH domain [Nocardiopsis mwathae]|uniref:Transcriptional regulator with XRE-family HTH domain n=1 Tax=Nocardiopsis mwathae TaxID=1472723 RepID=A0A7W9YK70_9ACTN|nr:helix-turn-helix transcriptional regulator [Nocardiopsis mwathae]MBB6173678.1 transcriptional regulator with XRE-family HTH domain [Nocardiopsis mwathae]
MHDDVTPPASLTFGQRVRRFRERNGQTRAILGGLVGRSSEWVKGIETGRLKTPRLPLLLRLAEVLGVDDLAELTGEERLSASTYTKAAHNALPAVRDALTTYQLTVPDSEPPTAPELRERVRQAWQLWHGSREHRTRVSAILPELLADLQHGARVLDGTDRRRVLTALAETYHLAQLYLSFQPAPELVTMTGDRAMTAAQDADDPHAIAVAAWYMNHVFRDAGERNEARIDLAMSAARLLRPDDDAEDLARWGLLHLAAALSFAKIGRTGDAWHYWDRADSAARRLGNRYSHPFLIFGRGMVDAYAITMNADLMRAGTAVSAAERIDLAPMPSATRRSFHLIELARAHSMQKENIAVIHLLRKAYDESPETARFNLFTRSAVMELTTSGGAMIRDDARRLAQKIGVQAAA